MYLLTYLLTYFFQGGGNFQTLLRRAGQTKLQQILGKQSSIKPIVALNATL